LVRRHGAEGPAPGLAAEQEWAMSGWARAALVVGLLIGCAVPARAEQGWDYNGGIEFRTGDDSFHLMIRNIAQLRYAHVSPDPGDSKGSFDIARYKVRLLGQVLGDWRFRVQADLAGGSERSQDLLEDVILQYSRKEIAQLWAGQGKVFFGRQELIDSDRLQFVDRSIASERFAHGRDVGVALVGDNANRTYSYQIGVYNGSGINKDEGDNIDYAASARLVVTPFGEFTLQESDPERLESSKLAVGVSVFTNTIGTEGFEETRVSRGGLEVAYRIGGFSVFAEFFTESEDALLNFEGGESDEEDTDGFYLQGGYLFRRGFEVAARYSEVLLDLPGQDVTESGVAFNYYFRPSHNYKVQTDLRRLSFENITGVEETIDADVFRLQLQMAF
jgi:phosphate-selective porin